MNLINKRLVGQKIINFEFPAGSKYNNSLNLIRGWQKALKDSDLEKTKEKSVQGKFLNTFFEEILGYEDVTTGLKEWTLIQHPKIENDSLEPDGSLGWFTKNEKTTRAVIELKPARTSLDKKQTSRAGKLTPVDQAYLYSTKYEGCNWIIVSNFKEIRLYNKNKTQEYYEKFDVLDLDKEDEFKRFYFIFNKANLISKDKEGVIDILAKNTTEAEQDITRKFYSDYKQIRLNLLDHLVNHNKSVTKEVLLEKTQKLLDRFIFTLFCEDTTSLLPLNIIKNTYERAISSLTPNDDRVWTEFKGLFLAIDKGNDRVSPPINAYNGGLFAYDPILDSLIIKDNFWLNLMNIAKYDFETDLNVNILGHIFEQSISDIENLKAELLGEEQNKNESKRKKEGIYYTPEYITRYIVENTLGAYLEKYPEKLADVKIIDPACGSGAFLNQAHSYLKIQWNIAYEEGRIKSKDADFGELFDINPAEADKEILLNNLFGTDLNQESVEITKLALWLKTARGTQPLENLDKNIKCGNSLINDSSVAGDKAFDWDREFKVPLFDVVIGNPPYVDSESMVKNDPKGRDFISKNYATAQGNWDLYIPFIEKGLSLLRENGYFGFIIPNKVLGADYALELRKWVGSNFSVEQIIDLSKEAVFDGVNVYPIILIISKKPFNKRVIVGSKLESLQFNSIEVTTLNDNWTIYNNRHYNLVNKIFDKNLLTLGQVASIYSASTVAEAYELQNLILESTEPDLEKNFLLINTGTIDRYTSLWGMKDLNYIRAKYLCPTIKKTDVKNKEWLNKEKLIVNGMGTQLETFLDYDKQYLPLKSTSVIVAEKLPLEYLQAILNSKIVNIVFESKNSSVSMAGGYMNINQNNLKGIPIPSANKSQVAKLTKLAKEMQTLSIKLAVVDNKYKSFIEANYKLTFARPFFDLGWNELEELFTKKRIALDINKKEELYGWFKSKQKELQLLHKEINDSDSQINTEVYKLYGLSAEEIALIDSK